MDSRYLLDRPIAFHRIFVTLTGSITAALMLSQGVYWSLRTNDEEGWFWKTQEEWVEETGLTRKEQENARKKLRDLKFWQEELRGVPAKLHYRIDSDLLNIALQSAPNKLAQQRESAVEKAKRAAQKREERKQVRTKETNQFARKVQTGTHETGEHSLYTESTTQTTDHTPHAHAHEISISQSVEPEPKPKAKTVRAVRQGEETITFSTPIPLEQEPSPKIAPSPLPPAFDPVAPISQDTFTAKAQSEQSEAQKVFGEYFPGKALSAHQWKLIAETVTDTPKWIRACQRWSEMYGDNWRKFGLLDWYRDGIPGVDNDRPTSGNFKGARKSEGESVSRPVAEFNYWEWQEDIKNGKYAHEPY